MVDRLRCQRAPFEYTSNMGAIELRLYASLTKWRKAPVAAYQYVGKKTVRDVLRENAIPEEDVAIIMINGQRGQPGTSIADGDSISLFPLIGGG
jgi:sulfur-carrier protein